MKGAAVIVMLITGGYCMAAENIRNWEFKSAEVAVIRVETGSGEIKLAVAEGPGVKAAVVGDYDPEKCEISAELSGGKLTLLARGKKRWFGGSADCKAGFAVSAPADKNLVIKTGAGRVEVGAFRSGAEISSGAGKITLAGLFGPIRVNSGAGAISGEMYSEKLDIRSGAGKVDLAWSAAPKAGEAAIRSGAGAVRLAFPKDSRLAIKHSTGAGSFHSELGSDTSAPFRLDIKTGAGAIDIKKR